jgi:DNA repair exonuclease SbcCD ATPase subunit
MLFTKIGIRNVKSFGNNLQTLEFDPEVGELVLLTGENGSGKSSFKESIEFALYGKVKKKSGDGTIAKDKLANRFNKNLHVGIEFLGSDSKRTHVRVERDVKPDKLNLWVDHKPYDRIGKGNIDDKIEEYVGLDYKSFLSFISMSINDFKNFMSLNSEDKKLLLDRLFNLSIINELKKILTGLTSQNQLIIEGYQKEMSNYDREINGLQNSIESLKEKVKTNIGQEIKEIKKLMLTKKEEFLKLESKVQKLTNKKVELDTMYDQEAEQLQNVNFEIKTIDEQIKLYNLGKCPTCKSDLTTETNQAYRKEIEDKRQTLIDIRDTIKQTMTQYSEIEKELNSRNKNTTESYNSIKFYLSDLKIKLDILKIEETNVDQKDVNGVQEFLKLIDSVHQRKETVEDLSIVHEKKKNIYKQLDKVFGENGIKKIIVGNLVKIINTYVKENLDLIKFPYAISLDDKFDAVITFMGEDIDPELLSNGEARKVNLSIMLAYLKVIRSKRRINILFLDEVFASIDLKSIEDILKLFRNFATEYKTIVFLVHHAQIGEPWFDRIISFEKNVTTMITEKRKNQLIPKKIESEEITNEEE